MDIDEIVSTICRDVAELPYLSKVDAPEIMQVTHEELENIVRSVVGRTTLQSLTFQRRARDWAVSAFSEAAASDKVERNHRFLEEALELVQACGCTASEAHQLVDYVFSLPKGDPVGEVGDVMNTIAALSSAQGIDMMAAAETKLDECWVKIDKTRAKWLAKPKHSPLPV